MPEIMINGPEGRLEGRYARGTNPNAPIALFLHPHPQHGGTMNNKVIYSLYHCLSERGFSCLRFNFRGVGRSQGSFSRGEGELADAAAALDWLQNYNENARECWIIGFSFGAWIAMQLLMRRPEISGFITIAPPANSYDFSFLAPCPSSGLIVQGDRDEIVPKEAVRKLAEKLNAQKGITVTHAQVEDANHFFSQHINQIVDLVGSYIDQREIKDPRLSDFGMIQG